MDWDDGNLAALVTAPSHLALHPQNKGENSERNWKLCFEKGEVASRNSSCRAERLNQRQSGLGTLKSRRSLHFVHYECRGCSASGRDLPFPSSAVSFASVDIKRASNWCSFDGSYALTAAVRRVADGTSANAL